MENYIGQPSRKAVNDSTITQDSAWFKKASDGQEAWTVDFEEEKTLMNQKLVEFQNIHGDDLANRLAEEIYSEGDVEVRKSLICGLKMMFQPYSNTIIIPRNQQETARFFKDFTKGKLFDTLGEKNKGDKQVISDFVKSYLERANQNWSPVKTYMDQQRLEIEAIFGLASLQQNILSPVLRYHQFKQSLIENFQAGTKSPGQRWFPYIEKKFLANMDDYSLWNAFRILKERIGRAEWDLWAKFAFRCFDWVNNQ